MLGMPGPSDVPILYNTRKRRMAIKARPRKSGAFQVRQVPCFEALSTIGARAGGMVSAYSTVRKLSQPEKYLP